MRGINEQFIHALVTFGICIWKFFHCNKKILPLFCVVRLYAEWFLR